MRFVHLAITIYDPVCRKLPEYVLFTYLLAGSVVVDVDDVTCIVCCFVTRDLRVSNSLFLQI